MGCQQTKIITLMVFITILLLNSVNCNAQFFKNLNEPANKQDIKMFLQLSANLSVSSFPDKDLINDQIFDFKDSLLLLNMIIKKTSEQKIFTVKQTRSKKSLEFANAFLELSNNYGSVDEIVPVQIVLKGNYDPNLMYSSGMAFTIKYHSDILLESIESNFFPTDLIACNNNESLNKAMIAAARFGEIENDFSIELFTINFKLRSETTIGKYDIYIAPTILNNVAAGYPPEGQAIDILVGSDLSIEDPTEPSAYPVIINSESDEFGNSVHTIHGSVTFSNNSINGKVITASPILGYTACIGGATISTIPLEYSVITDIYGEFTLKAIPTGSYTLSISSSYFSPIKKSISVNNGINNIGLIELFKPVCNNCYSQEEVDMLLKQSNIEKDEIILEKEQQIIELSKSIASMYTQEYLERSILEAERRGELKYDINDDGKVGIEEIIKYLETLSNIRLESIIMFPDNKKYYLTE